MRKSRAVLAILSAVFTLSTLAASSAALAAAGTHEATVQVIAVDLQAKTITIKNEKGEEKTAPVTGHAIEELKTVKAGEQVVVTCQDNEKGEHLHVTMIKKVEKK